jgi:hypothetical protein
MTRTYRIETGVIGSVTLYVDAEDERAALDVARDANDTGPTAVRALLASCGAEVEAESLALETASVEPDDV